MSRLWHGKKGRRHQPINHKYTLVILASDFSFYIYQSFYGDIMQNYTISKSLSLENVHRIQNCMITESTFKLFLLSLNIFKKKEMNKGLQLCFVEVFCFSVLHEQQLPNLYCCLNFLFKLNFIGKQSEFFFLLKNKLSRTIRAN